MSRFASIGLAAFLSGATLAATPSHAADEGEIAALYDAMRMGDVIEIMAEEGRAYGAELQADMFPGRGGAAWRSRVERLYETESMNTLVRQSFGAYLADTDIDPLLTFFESDRGRQIIDLEVEARRAMMDPAVEEAAERRLSQMRAEGAARLDVLDAYVETNGLVENNVVGALNSNYAFYSGMLEAGAFESDTTEEQLLDDVWAQEADIRADTIDWVYAYLALAYQPLSNDDIEVYTALSRTDEGRALNQAVFGAFDEMYTTISRALGRGVAQFMAGEDI